MLQCISETVQCVFVYVLYALINFSLISEIHKKIKLKRHKKAEKPDKNKRPGEIDRKEH